MIQLLGKKDAGKTKRDAVDEDEITQFQSGAAGAGALEQREKEDALREALLCWYDKNTKRTTAQQVMAQYYRKRKKSHR